MKYTIVITTFNSQKWIGKGLDGIAQLIYPPDEIILVDDFSNDETVIVVRSRENEFSNFRLIQNQKNMGQSYSRNLGVREAKNTYIIFMDDDDVSYPKRANTHLKALSDGADFSYVSSTKSYDNGYSLLAQNDDLSSSTVMPIDLIRHLTNWTQLKGSQQIYAPSSTLAVKRDSFLKLNGFREDLRRLEDIELACRALTFGLVLNWSSEIMVERFNTLGIDKNANANYIGEIAVLESVKNLLGKREFFVAREMAIFRKDYFERNWFAIVKNSVDLLIVIFISPSKLNSIYKRVRHDRAQRR
jgi:glycosyltransferase involved in cell wall biosynthesis